MTGQPEDSQFIDTIEVNKEYTLKDLKEIVLSMPQLEFAKDFVSLQLYKFSCIATRIDQVKRKAEKPILWKNLP